MSVAAHAEEAAAVQLRLARTARYLSSDELGGRGVGTPGIGQAAEYIRQEFESFGLSTEVFDGQPWQPFTVTLSSELAEGATARLMLPASAPEAADADAADQAAGVSDDGQTEANADAAAKTEAEPEAASEIQAAGSTLGMVVGEDFNPLAIGGDGRFDMPLAFAGYGITAPEAEYDDYAGVDVAGKAVIILRHEPQQANPDSAFNGADHSRHAPFTQKLSNAVEHGAVAVVFVTDKYEIDTRLAQADQRIEAIKQRLAEL
ncbi:MAG: hypothetical protein AAF790_05105, partial [Planctomycetota bacterium]